jgi:hypothetical protein
MKKERLKKLNSNEIEQVMSIGFTAGLKAGLRIGKQRVFEAIEDLHLHTENGAIVYVAELEELLEERDAQRTEAQLP